MRIGELAAQADVSDKTLRYYEAIGVLAAPARTPSGYRDYRESALQRLCFIRSAQAVGLTLGEIREVTAYRDRGEVPCEHVLGLIHRRSRQIGERIQQLQTLQRELQRLARRARTLQPEDCDASEVCHLITPPRNTKPARRTEPASVRGGGRWTRVRSRRNP